MIRSLNVFAAILKCPKEELIKLLKDLDDPKRSRKYQYIYYVEKSNGKLRPIVPSTNFLKIVQKRIKDNIFSKIKFPYYITGGLKGRSGAINGKIHAGNSHYFQTDLSSFFSNVSCQMVYESLIALGFSSDIAYAIMRITTYKGYLAQGPCTSPFLANLVGLKMDKAILKICSQMGLNYTRFVDDLTFSHPLDFKESAKDILATIADCGFTYNHSKTHYRIGKTQVTGVVTGANGLRGTSAQLKKIDDPNLDILSLQGVKGYLGYVGKINRSFDVEEYKEAFKELNYPKNIYPRSDSFQK